MISRTLRSMTDSNRFCLKNRKPSSNYDEFEQKNTSYLYRQAISNLTTLYYSSTIMKSKTAALIRQKQLRTQQKPSNTLARAQRDQGSPNIELFAEFASTPLKLRHLSHYDAFSLTVHPPEPQSPRLRESNNEDLCELEKQNYRLIESNYNMLARHAATIQSIRHSLLESIMMVEECHYVHAVKVLYALLDRIRNIAGSLHQGQLNFAEPASPKGLKEKTSSAVEEYLIFDSNSPDEGRHKGKSSNLRIVPQNLSITHFPEPKSQFLQLKDHGRFIHVSENENNAGHSYPQILTPHFKPRNKHNVHAYSLQESYDFNIESELEEPSNRHILKSIRLSEEQQGFESSQKQSLHHILERSEYDINSNERAYSSSKSAGRAKKHHKNVTDRQFEDEKQKNEKIQDLYRALLTQASLIEQEAPQRWSRWGVYASKTR